MSARVPASAADRDWLGLWKHEAFERIDQIVDQVAQAFFDPVSEGFLASLVFTHARCLILEYGGRSLHVNHSAATRCGRM